MDHLMQLVREQIVYFDLDVRRGIGEEDTEEAMAIVHGLSRTRESMSSLIDRLSAYRKEKRNACK